MIRVTARNGNVLLVDESTRRNLESQGLLQAPALEDSKRKQGAEKAKASAPASRRSRSKG